MSVLVTQLKLCFQDVGIVPCSKCNRILFFSGQDNDINLMKACWNELFALGLAQCSSVMNVGTILSAIISHLQTSLQEGRRAACKVAQLNVMQRSKNNVLLCAGGAKHHRHWEVSGSLTTFVLICLDLLRLWRLCFAFYREVVSRASKTSNGAHLEDAGVL